MCETVGKSAGKRRGRPPAYDAERALAAALDQFWTAGYAATSLDALSAATGMNRPSLYAAFGDKRALFQRVLQDYRARGGGIMAALAAEGQSLAASLEAAYAAALDLYFSGRSGARGCLLTGAALAGAVEDAALREVVLGTLTDLDEGFAALFRRGIARREIAPDADAEALGRLASGLLQALSARARSGAARADLDAFARDAVAMLIAAAR